MKARLEFDMPESCFECKLLATFDDEENVCAFNPVKELHDDYADSRAEWCPLKAVEE